MLFSQTVEYALRSVVCLASQAGCPQTGKQIAEATQVPPGYLAKVMNSLRRTGIVESRRGLGGGYVLAKTGEELTVLEVVNTIDPIERIAQCPLGLNSHGLNLCPLHKRLDEAIGMIEDVFIRTKIIDLVIVQGSDSSACSGVSTTSTGGQVKSGQITTKPFVTRSGGKS